MSPSETVGTVCETIVQYGFYIHISTTQSLNLHVCIHLQHITTREQSNTIKCFCPGSDIIVWLEEHVYNEILDLNTHILDTLPEEETSTPEMWHYWVLKLKDLQFINS